MARLCIVINRGLSKKDRGLMDYLGQDRSIAFEWTTDFEIIECSKHSKGLLGQFSL